ncbi:glutamine synthetase beta-grasp domain-containing protein [archaeon]|nr:glutamine synthetase beta-grasp domain-containing protein [archaeon]
MKIKAEYIWLDGTKPTPQIRSKTKILEVNGIVESLEDIPVWGFDGSSTNQAEGHSSDCVLRPIRFYKDPVRGGDHILVLNEVELPNGDIHSSNTRSDLRELVEKYGDKGFKFGIEQEYTLFKGDVPLAWAELGKEPKPQGPYYCAVGAGKIFGRHLVEKHIDACLEADLLFDGINWEVMPGQSEYQIGPGDPLKVADDLIVARYLMDRLGEDYGITVSLAAKPKEGDWNGAGAHTNFSTKAMMQSSEVFEEVLEKLKTHHEEHITVYGDGIEKRLTGKHETCPYTKFRHGVSDRGASIRVPWRVAKEGKGYLEDRRPCANIDPYVVLSRLIKTISE